MITPEMLAGIPFFSGISDKAREEIAARSADVALNAGEWLIHEGDSPDFFVLIEGRLDLYKQVNGHERPLGRFVAGDFFGEVPLLLGSRAVASLQAAVPSRALRLDETAFQDLVAADPELSSKVMTTMMERVDKLRGISAEPHPNTITLVGDRWDLVCHAFRDFLARNRVPFHWREPAGPSLASGSPLPENLACPYVVLENGQVLENPTLRSLAEQVGLQTAPASGDYDVAIVGGGPAGLAAAVYGSSEGLRTILIEKEAAGGQAGTSSRIENYLGFPNGLSGDDLSARASQQARRFGAEILLTREVTRIEACPLFRKHHVELDGGDSFSATSVIVASGVSWRKLGLDGEYDLIGRGVYYGAGRTEALNVRGKDVYLVGAGNSAGQAAMFFTNYANSATLLVRGDNLERTMSQYLIDQLRTKHNIAIELNTEVAALSGEEHLRSITTRNRVTGEEAVRPTEYLFVFIGADAQTGWLPDEIQRNELGYIMTGRDLGKRDGSGAVWPLERDPYLLETSVPGIFAAGDVRCGSIKRVSSGVGEGSMAIAFIHQYRQDVAEQEKKS